MNEIEECMQSFFLLPTPLSFPGPLSEQLTYTPPDKLAAVIKANDNISCSSLDFGAIFSKDGNFEQCYALHPYYYYGLKNDRQTRYGLLLRFDPTLVKGLLGILIHISYQYLYSHLLLALFGAYTLNLWTGQWGHSEKFSIILGRARVFCQIKSNAG